MPEETMTTELPMLLVWVIKTVVIFGALISAAGLTTLAERKVSAWIQYRVGPNRVGPFGLLQPLADGVKFIFKEELVPDGANRLMFRLAPIITAAPAMLCIAVIPFAGEVVIGDYNLGNLSITDLSISVLYVGALTGLGIYGIILGGWSSNSKYSLMGALRASAQMVSYELTLLLAILAVVLMSGSLDLRSIAETQAIASEGNYAIWNMFLQPVAFVLFIIAMFAETNRHPFDFAECEPELVGGFHTEYSSMKFALFFLGEYCAIIVMCCLVTTFFLGGYDVPFWEGAPWFIQLASFVAKATAFVFLFIWVRWTLPRFRYDQLMGLGWKVMLPIALVNVTVTGAVVSFGLSPLLMPIFAIGALVPAVMLFAQVKPGEASVTGGAQPEKGALSEKGAVS
ncbi:MAG: NADH-quinone oxidoreductase subunit H [Planctomycetota bacterium]|jgi:NADH-quinone oxidoreductase subunit H